MFQLGSLVVLCGLLIGTSESLLGNIGNAVNNLNVLKPVSGDALPDLNVDTGLLQKVNVDEGLLQNVKSDAELLQNVKLDGGSLQEITSLEGIKDTIQGALNKLNLDNLNLLSPLSVLGIKINEFKILNVQVGLLSGGKGLDLNMPFVVNASVKLPVIGPTVDVAVSLDLITSLAVQTDAKTNLLTLAVGKCSSDTDNISISLLGGRVPFINNFLNNVSDLLTKTVSSILQNQICPLIQFILSHLDVTFTQNLLCWCPVSSSYSLWHFSLERATILHSKSA